VTTSRSRAKQDQYAWLDDPAQRAKHGRKHARDILSNVLMRSWQPVHTSNAADGTVTVTRGGDFVCQFNWGALRASLSRESFVLIGRLYTLLEQQAFVAQVAVGVAAIELGVDVKRQQGTLVASKKRRDFAPKRAKVQDEIAKIAAKGGDPQKRKNAIAKAANCTVQYVGQVLSEAEKGEPT
jgi:hypothetical protein